MNSKLLSASLCCLSLAAAAEDTTNKETVYEASAELGMLYTTGDNKSADVKAGFDVNYEKDAWKHTGQFDLLVKKTNQKDAEGNENLETSDQKWSIVGQSNYTLDDKSPNYLFGNASYEDNRFSNFDNQSSISAGWGRRWYETEKATLDADIGPGYKRDVLRDSDETDSSLIVQAQAVYQRQINEHVEFKQMLVARVATKSDSNSTYKSETSISTKLIETLQLKFSVTIDHNTEVAEDKENTNTQTAITLVYSF